jgi:hypothetical protein
MSLFDFFKKKENVDISWKPKVEILVYDSEKNYKKKGPCYLENFTEDYDSVYSSFYEWKRNIIASNGNSKFKIKYYGKPHNSYKNLIVRTDFAPSLVIAVEPNSGEEIVLFDGCCHGYDNIYCIEFSEEQRKNRPTINNYIDTKGNDLFSLSVKVFYQYDFEEEEPFLNKNEIIEFEVGRNITIQEAKKEDNLILYIDDDGLIELRDGRKLLPEDVWRDSFDFIQIIATNDSGKSIEIVEHELA